MSSIVKLKEQARRHEQREEWDRAIQTYRLVLEASEEAAGEVDLPLFNRIGDLHLRLGQNPDAVRYYEEAAERYAESGLFNNAIALCNKALRYAPGKPSILHKLGHYCAEQGFLTDARRWYLEYAETQFRAGNVKDALAALEEFADTTDDPEIRELLADRLVAHEHPREAAAQLLKARALRLRQGEDDVAAALAERALELDPDADPDAAVLDANKAAEHPAEAPEDFGLDAFEDLPEPADLQPTAGLPLLDQDAAAGLEPADAGIGEEDAEGDVGLEISGVMTGFGLETDDDDAGAIDDGGIDIVPTAAGEGVSFEDVEAETVLVDRLHEDVDDPAPPTDLSGDLEDVVTPFGESGEEELAGEEEVEDVEPLPLLDDAEPDAADDAFGTDIGGDLPLLDVTGGAGHDDDEPADDFDFGSLSFGTSTAVTEPAAEPAPAPDLPDLDEELAAAEALAEQGELQRATASLERLHTRFAAAGRLEEAFAALDVLLRLAPDDLRARQHRVEYAFRADDEALLVEAYLALGAALERSGAETKARAIFQRVLELDAENAVAREALWGEEPGPGSEYVDLASLVQEPEPAGGTRFVVAEEEPTGDEEQDFADILAQFKAKVSSNLPVDDPSGHYDLGLAYKEMGLLDEAIAEFQTALRGGSEELRIYEELGQCFMMKDQHNIAVKVFARATQLPTDDASSLLGVYYHMGRSLEELGRRPEAKDAYERVVGIEIGFRDAADRLARL